MSGIEIEPVALLRAARPAGESDIASRVTLPFPLGWPEHQSAEFRLESVSTAWDPVSLERLRALASAASGSPVDTVVAATSVLLARFTRSADVAVAAVARPVGGTPPTVSVVAGELSSDASFAEVLESIAAGEGQPVQQLAPGRDGVPIVVAPGGTSLSPLSLAGTTLWLTVEDDFATTLYYDAGSWSRADAERIVRHLAALLRAAAAEPALPVAALDIGAEAGAEFPDTTVAYEDLTSAPERFVRWAERAPDRMAVVHGDVAWTYGDLLERVSRLRDVLAANGVGPATRVALLLDRSPELVAATLAVSLSGAAYVGLDLNEPGPRLATMLDDADCRLILTRAADDSRLPEGDHPVLVVDDVLDGQGSTGEFVSPAPGDACYVTYTSGSTGLPKGVLVPHRGLTNLVNWYQETFEVVPGDRMPQLARPSFDGWSLEVWPCLANGATLCIPDEGIRRSAVELARWLCREEITTCFVTTALGVELFGQPWAELGSRLRSLLVGGEKLPAYPPAGLPFRLYNVYGPTETSMLATCGEMSTPRSGAPPIGTPLANVRAHVLDERLSPVPAGAVGELYLGGEGVALGYLNRPELTALKFVDGPSGRQYATGDLVRVRPGGSIEFVGRVDNQVKLRGFRIELGEVEAAVRSLPGVRDAVAVIHTPESGGGRLMAYVRPDPRRRPDGSGLRARLSEVLPDYMVPTEVTVLDAFPLTPHGKTDRGELARRAPSGGGDGDAPATDLERVLAELWCEVLSIGSVSREDSFFDLGGDSLTAMRLAARARARGIRLGAEHLFEYEVLHELAAELEQGETNPGEAA
ncbi:non-ribosomal peptide synthetase [Amycolatopsis japonica]|uniref:non-ribosomal peptide synthetase n=1 Tax=Amycolatopsis japonica TaxID=208439 RepID=UPI003801DA64